LRLEAKLSFTYETEREAESVVRAVSPDNVKAPSGVTVTTARDGSDLFGIVRCERSLQTFLATLDDLLACISVAERTFESVKDAEP
jgi:hypothetical protein